MFTHKKIKNKCDEETQDGTNLLSVVLVSPYCC